MLSRAHSFCLLLVFGAASALTAADKPNIVFFLIDDLGRTDVGFMGGKDIQTPNIDTLAKGGAILDSHYVQPVCSPTRAALMTGRYATHTGIYTVIRPHAKWGLPLNERTLANALKDAGFETAITGKWHLGEFEPTYTPTSRGFDHQYGHYFGAIDYNTKMREQTRDWYRDDKPNADEGYSTHLLAKEASRLIREKDKAKPLFLYVPFNGVHAPHQVPEKYLEPYGHLKGTRRMVAGMLAAVDEAIGQIVETLDQQGLRENTLIIFSSDNGGPNPKNVSTNGDLRAGKGTIYEGGTRVCAFANYPGKIPSGVTIREPMHMVDWYPTLVKLAGGSIEESKQKLPLDGLDVWPMLTQSAKSPHDAILLVQSPTRAAVRVGDWKLVMNGGPPGADDEGPQANTPRNRRRAATKEEPTFELFNLASDISESKDLSKQEPERLAKMRATLDSLLKNAVTPGNEKI